MVVGLQKKRALPAPLASLMSEMGPHHPLPLQREDFTKRFRRREARQPTHVEAGGPHWTRRLHGCYKAIFLRTAEYNPNNPDPNSHAAAGTGTAATLAMLPPKMVVLATALPGPTAALNRIVSEPS